MTPPRVTVLASTYNDAPFVREAIDSVLAQTFTDFELLIIHDGGTDGSREIVASYRDPRIRLADNPQNLGLARSLNRGLRLARGELIARFDTDDVCLPERLAIQVEYLDRHPDVAVVGVQASLIDTASRPIRQREVRRPVSDAGIRWFLTLDVPVIHGAAMFRRGVVLKELGGYDERYRILGEDADLWLRVAHRHRLSNLSRTLLRRRINPWSVSNSVADAASIDHVAQWVPHFHREFQALMGADVPESVARTYLQIRQPHMIVAPAELDSFARFLGAARRRFDETVAGAKGNREIDAQIAHVQLLMAMRLASGNGRAALRAFGSAFRSDALRALEALPKVVLIALTAGRARHWWHARRARAAQRARAARTRGTAERNDMIPSSTKSSPPAGVRECSSSKSSPQ